MIANSAPLTPVQLQVLSLLAAGSTVTAAAEKAGIHRNTIANWRRSSEAFRHEYQTLRSEQADHWRDEMQSLAPLALETLRYAMANMNTPPGVRVRAALAVLKSVTDLPPVHREPKSAATKVEPEPQTADSTQESPSDAPTADPEQTAQSCTNHDLQTARKTARKTTRRTAQRPRPKTPHPHNTSSFPAAEASVPVTDECAPTPARPDLRLVPNRRAAAPRSARL